jgi:DNA-binding response OmpR family regulator
MRILLVEDEKFIAKPIQNALERRTYAVDYAQTGPEGLQLAKLNEYDCLILDLNLPEIDGIEIAKTLRTENINTPILMLTARTSQRNKWEGFESGADDYLTKPFDLKELLLRVKALIRRNSKEQNEVLSIGGIVLDPVAIQVKKGDIQIELNNKEFGILEYLLRNKGSVISAEDLLEHVWDREIDAFTQTVRTNIKTLRKKVDQKKEIILTVRGKGYVIR